MKLLLKKFLLVGMLGIFISCSDDGSSTHIDNGSDNGGGNGGGEDIVKPAIDAGVDDALGQIGGRPTDMVNWQKSEDRKISNTATEKEEDNYFLPKAGVAGAYKKAKVVLTNGTVDNHGKPYVITNEVTNKNAIEGTFTIIEEPFILQDFSNTDGFVDVADKQGYDQVYTFTPTTEKEFISTSMGGSGTWEDVDLTNQQPMPYIAKFTDNKTSFIQLNKELSGKYMLATTPFEDAIEGADNYTILEQTTEE